MRYKATVEFGIDDEIGDTTDDNISETLIDNLNFGGIVNAKVVSGVERLAESETPQNDEEARTDDEPVPDGGPKRAPDEGAGGQDVDTLPKPSPEEQGDEQEPIDDDSPDAAGETVGDVDADSARSEQATA